MRQKLSQWTFKKIVDRLRILLTIWLHTVKPLSRSCQQFLSRVLKDPRPSDYLIQISLSLSLTCLTSLSHFSPCLTNHSSYLLITQLILHQITRTKHPQVAANVQSNKPSNVQWLVHIPRNLEQYSTSFGSREVLLGRILTFKFLNDLEFPYATNLDIFN